MHQTTLDSTPRCAASSARAPGNRSGTPSRKPGTRSKSTSKTPSERVRCPLHALALMTCNAAGCAHDALGCCGRLRCLRSQKRCLFSQRHIWVKYLRYHFRSGSAVKRGQDMAFGSPLGSQHGRREVSLKRAMRDRQRSGSGSGAKPGTSTARRRKRRALLDILEKASPPDPHCMGDFCGCISFHAVAEEWLFPRLAVSYWARILAQEHGVWAPFAE